MSFWNDWRNKFDKVKEALKKADELTPEIIEKKVREYSKEYHSERNGERTTEQYREFLENKYKMLLREKKTKPDTVSSLFKLKNFILGFKALAEDNGLSKQVTDAQRNFLESSNTTDLEADIFSKLIMLYEIARDTYNTTTLTDEEREEKKLKYKDDLYKILDKELYKKELIKAGQEIDNTFDLKYQKYVDMLLFRLKTYGNQHLGYTEELNLYSKELQDWTASQMQEMLNGNFSRDVGQLADYEQYLNNLYLNLILKGSVEAQMNNYPLKANEIVAHQRAEKIVSSPFFMTPTERAEFNIETGDELRMTTFIDEKTSELLNRNKEKIKNLQGYNSDDYIAIMFDDASGGYFNGFGTDNNGNTIYKFRSDNDDADDLNGLLGFNKWRKEGDFNELFYGEGGREKLEDLALTYAALKEELGEEEAKRWLQTRFQHYASEGISGAKQFENAVLGFGKDLLADAAEIVGGAYGLITGAAEGIGGTVAAAFNGSNVGDVWAEAMGDAFDNGLTRWGALYSSTGYFLSNWQDKANKIGFNYNDNIIDPDRLDFLFKGGGSGWGYFLAETGRQASHTMFSVWSGKLLGSGFAKGGAWITRALGGSIKATKKGYRIGTTVGLALSGSNEGIMDGIQVRDDVYKQGMLQVELEIAERAIFETLSQNVNVDDNLALATFLLNNHVGDLQVDDGNGNITTINNLIQRDENGNLVTTLDRRLMVDLLKSSEFGKLLIEEYKNREDVAAQYELMLKDIEHTAIRNGAATATIENFINGSIRSFNAGTRANLKGLERLTRRRLAAMTVNKQGKANMKDVGVSFALRLSAANAGHEAMEEGLQAITQQTFTAVGENSIRRYIENTYDTDTWAGLILEWAATMKDVVENAGAGVFKAETYEAAILGAIGSMMGFGTIKRNSGGKHWYNKVQLWDGSVFNIRSTINAENEARKEMTDAITNAIQKEGGLNALKSMVTTSHTMHTYLRQLLRNPEQLDENNELAVEALMDNVSLLNYIKDTEYGRDMMAHLAYQSDMLGENFGDFENVELSPEERLKQKLLKAKEFLTYKTDDEVLSKKKEAALQEVRTWMSDNNLLVREIEEIAENPTDMEAQALIEIVETARLTNQLIDLMSEIDKTNSRDVLGLNFVAKNALNVKSLLLLNLEERLEAANAELTRIAENSWDSRSNTTLSIELRLAIAVLGNSEELRNKSVELYNETINNAKNEIKKLEEEIKLAKKDHRSYKVLHEDELAEEKKEDIKELKARKLIYNSIIKTNKDHIGKRIKQTKQINEIAEEMSILTAYDILTLTPHERAIMLDKKNEEKYSQALIEEIKKARKVAQRKGASRLIRQTNTLLALIEYNTKEIEDIVTNGHSYDELVRDAEQLFRANILNYRYYKDINREMTTNEVREFMTKLNEDVKEGLITEEEKNQLIQKATNNERVRNAGRNEEEVKVGWEKYNRVLNQSNRIYNAFKNANIIVDKVMYDDFMLFLRDEALMTIEDFNNLTQQLKQELLSSSQILKSQNNAVEVDKYIEFAADTLNKYENTLIIGGDVNEDIARGKNEGGTAELTIVAQPPEEYEREATEHEIKNNEILLFRTDRDSVSTFGSRINRIINFITDPSKGILADNSKYKATGTSLLEVIRTIAMDNTLITSIKDLYNMIDDAIPNQDIRNTWYEIKDAIEKLAKTEKANRSTERSNTHRDRLLNGDRSANSSTMVSARVSSLRRDKTKKPIVDFLELHNYNEAGKYASRTSLGTTGRGMLVYYVVDPTTTLNYSRELGSEYSHTNNLPIFTCVKVSDDFEGGFDVTIGNEKVRVAPIGVLEESIPQTNEVLGIAWTQAIRNTAVELYSEATNQPILVTAKNGMPIASAPLNYANWVRLEGAADYSGGRSIISEIRGFGNQVSSAISRIIDNLKVGTINGRDNLIYYDNHDVEFRLPIIRLAGITKLQDETKGQNIIDAISEDIGWRINNKIINLFYGNIFEANNSLKNIIGSRLNLLNNLNKDELLELNKKVNDILSLSFYIGNYNGCKDWKYEIDAEALIDKKFVLRAIPYNNEKTEQSKDALKVTKETVKNKQIVLLSFGLEDGRMFDEQGNLDLGLVHANTILQRLAMDEAGNIRTRGNEYGSNFATVLLSKTLVKHANDIFEGEKDKKLTDTQKREKRESSRSVLSQLIEGGGLMVEGQIDTNTDQVILQRPTIYDKNKQISTGVVYTPALAASLSKIDLMSGATIVDSIDEKVGRENVERKVYIEIKKWLGSAEGKQKMSHTPKRNMYVTTLAGWSSGTTRLYANSENTSNPITLAVGSNVDLIYRHVLWTSKYNRNVEERESIKKIPRDATETGEEYYTDQELQDQFGFHAAHVKAVALAFSSYLLQLELDRGWTFVTNVIKPKATIEVTDKETGKKYKVPISGELDLLAVGMDGKIHPIDFKTIGFLENSDLEALRSNDIKERQSAITTLKSENGKKDLEGYKRLLNLYQTALMLKGFSRDLIGEAVLLFTPVAYPNSLSVKTEVKPNSEYGNETIMNVDRLGNTTTPYLEGLGLFEVQDDKDVVKLTEIPVPFNDDFLIDIKDILFMELKDRDFLRKNPELTETIDELLTENAAKITIELPIEKPKEDDSESNIRTERVGTRVRRTGTRRREATLNLPSSTQPQQLEKPKILPFGKTRANYREITSLLEILKKDKNFDKDFSKVEFIVDGKSVTFTVLKMERYLAKLELQAQEEGRTIEELYNERTVENVCEEVGCGK